jgi:hypothetical protein
MSNRTPAEERLIEKAKNWRKKLVKGPMTDDDIGDLIDAIDAVLAERQGERLRFKKIVDLLDSQEYYVYRGKDSFAGKIIEYAPSQFSFVAVAESYETEELAQILATLRSLNTTGQVEGGKG